MITSCSDERIIDESDKSWKALVAVSQNTSKLQLIEYPAGNIINDDVYFQANGERLTSAPELIAEFGRMLFLLQRDEYKITVLNSDTYIKTSEISYANESRKPTGIAFPQHGTSAYVIFEQDSMVSFIDLTVMKHSGYINLNKICRSIASAANQVYVAHPYDNIISVIETNTNSKVAEIPVPEYPVLVGFTDDALRVVCVSAGKGKFGDDTTITRTNANVSLIDVSTRKITATQPLGLGIVKPVEQAPLSLAITSKIYSYIGTQNYLLRFNTKTAGSVSRINNAYTESVIYNFKRDEILIIIKENNIRKLILSSAQSFSESMTKTLPDGFICLIPK